MLKNHKQCLLLNSDYTPLRLVSWQRAMVLSYIYNSSVEILHFYHREYIRTSSEQLKLPAVIKLNKYVNIRKHSVNFSRRNLFIRDKYTCQYCDNILSQSKLTYDHVIPKSKYAKAQKKQATCWTNVVTCCPACNKKKANKTPREANMKLIRQPYEPKYSTEYLTWYEQTATIPRKDIYVEWLPYLEPYIKKNE